MQIAIKHYSDLTIDELYDLISLRVAVFVVEQNCPYQDLDGLDKDAYHILIKEDGLLIATLRILKAGKSYREPAIGRVASHPNFRDRGLGHILMEEAMKFLTEKLSAISVRLSAQSHLTRYYEKHGFRSTDKEYLEDGIPHTEMLYSSDLHN